MLEPHIRANSTLIQDRPSFLRLVLVDAESELGTSLWGEDGRTIVAAVVEIGYAARYG